MTNSTTHLPWQQSLGEFLAEVIQRNPNKVFLEISGQPITYRQFDDAIKRTAGMFQAAGIRHGDRVCLFLPNCPEFMYCWFGLSLIGAISVPINTAYKRDEAAYILNNAGAAALVTHTSLLDAAREAADLAPELRHKLLVGGTESGWTGFTESLASATPHQRSSSRLPAGHLHARVHLRHHGQPQGCDAHPPDVRRLRPGVRPLD